jgi:hypothetical protein
MAENIFYVYQYTTEDGLPFYIGKGSKDRINESHAPWVNLPPKEFRHYIKTRLTESEAFDLEIELIKRYGRKIDGGILDNIKISRWVAQAGWKHSEETKKKISKNNTGKIRTEEQKQNYRKPKTAEHAEKIRQANLGRKDDGRHEKTSQTMKGRPWSDARRAAYLKNKQLKDSLNVMA